MYTLYTLLPAPPVPCRCVHSEPAGRNGGTSLVRFHLTDPLLAETADDSQRRNEKISRELAQDVRINTYTTTQMTGILRHGRVMREARQHESIKLGTPDRSIGNDRASGACVDVRTDTRNVESHVCDGYVSLRMGRTVGWHQLRMHGTATVGHCGNARLNKDGTGQRSAGVAAGYRQLRLSSRD
jgi:hypothetical protein